MSRNQGEGRTVYESVRESVRGDPKVKSLHASEQGEMTFEKTIYLKDGGRATCRYILFTYPDIHKIEAWIIPSPEIPEKKYTAVTKWLLQQQNRKYQNEYGISPAYRTWRGNLAINGTTRLRERPEKDLYQLLNTLERCLAEDFPAILDIYFGVIPNRIRTELSEEMKEYQEELGERAAVK